MRVPALAFLAVLVIAVPASGQRTSDLNAFLSGGVSIPSGSTDFSKNWASDVNLGLGLSYRLSPEFFSLTGIDVNSFTYDPKQLVQELGLAGTYNVVGDPTFIITLSSNIKFLVMEASSTDRGSIAPYLIGGVGICYKTIPSMTTSIISGNQVTAISTPSDDEAAFTASAGAGFELPGGGLPGMFAEARYAVAFTKGQNTAYVPIRIGLRADF